MSARRRPGAGRAGRPGRRLHRCALAATRTKVVFGVGDPGRRPDAGGRGPRATTRTSRASPSSAPRGKLLDRLLGEIGIKRSDVYIANVLKCRPPKNRDPRPEEIDACSGLSPPPADPGRSPGGADPGQLRHPASAQARCRESPACADRCTRGGIATWCPPCIRRRCCARGPGAGADAPRLRPGGVVAVRPAGAGAGRTVPDPEQLGLFG